MATVEFGQHRAKFRPHRSKLGQFLARRTPTTTVTDDPPDAPQAAPVDLVDRQGENAGGVDEEAAGVHGEGDSDAQDAAQVRRGDLARVAAGGSDRAG